MLHEIEWCNSVPAIIVVWLYILYPVARGERLTEIPSLQSCDHLFLSYTIPGTVSLGSHCMIIDRETWEIMHLVASVHLSVCPSVCLRSHAWTVRGSALPSAAKSNRSHYQFKVFVCVSLISGRIRIIARMRSIAVLIWNCRYSVTYISCKQWKMSRHRQSLYYAAPELQFKN